MFETSQIRAGKADTGRVTMVSISIAAHTLVVVGCVAASVASVDFPRGAPDQWMRVQLVRAVPLPPPAPNPARAVERPAARPLQTHADPAPAQPTAIPDSVTPVQEAQTVPIPGNGVPGQVPDPGTGGKGGLTDGVADGVGDPAAGVVVEDGTYEVGGDVSAPRVLSRVNPVYPVLAAHNRMAGLVIVQCLIDKQGRVRDVTVVKSSFGAFEQAAVEAVRQWTFSPGMMRGRAVDTVFRLTVTFTIRDAR